ncbi:MAG: glutamine-hydrolyzing carbamoyl-phosphate synthase small subunit [Planctomycetota bacterium]|nr:glutamine-hydrolyzing carbamoyl-phosphate synthase small subunit [Planctomycetota bacterium]
MHPRATIALEDGRVFHGLSFGAAGERTGEIVFNTSMCGYQEILTDPSYKGQIVVMTCPLIGNYGTNPEDEEADGPQVEGFVVREASRLASNWRNRETLREYLSRRGVVAVEGVDTRAITRHIRSRGAMKAIISTLDHDEARLAAKAKASPGLSERDLVREVTCRASRGWRGSGDGEKPFRVVAVDCGCKRNILRLLETSGCVVTLARADASAAEIMSLKPDGLFLSNGPGDPAVCSYLVSTVRDLLGEIPIFGICLGHQIMGLAAGGRTYKLKFGHRGANHPVKELATGRIDITSQNHGYAVDAGSLDPDVAEVTHLNLYDGTVEGLRFRKVPAFAVQYHPEAAPGPHDARHLFRRFAEMMAGRKGVSLS